MRASSLSRASSIFMRSSSARAPVFPANAAQVGVGGQEVLHPLLTVDDGFLDWSDGGDGPEADETGLAFLRRTANLHRKRNNLGEQDGRQHNQVLIAA